ncbi:DUF4129 domain-containing protein [bacterium]|nr:MAG: DUF4129 domain-containing protein [bacterium]
MTSRLWRAISILVVVLSAAASQAQEWTALEARTKGLSERQAAKVLLESPLVQETEELSDLTEEKLVEAVRIRARIEAVDGKSSSNQSVQKIKASMAILDGKSAQDANWLSNALERLKRLQPDFDTPKAPNVNSGFAGAAVIYLMWALLAIAVGFFLFFALRHLASIKRRSVVRALVEDDEPERTVDEWLLQAKDLEAQGRFREAVRALYLACLLRLDEAGVARFIRHETNWEHQHRIDASPKRPPNLDMRPATQLMDRVWYGMRTEGSPDVARIRDIYESVLREALTK